MHDTPVAIVTGASRGIGAAIAVRLAADGFAVVVGYAGNTAAADDLTGRIVAAGGRAIAVQGNVADPVTATRLFDTARDRFGGVDVVVNNAGIGGASLLAETDDAAFDRLIAVNLKGTFNMLRTAAQRLRDGGRIVSLSSSLVAAPHETFGPYAATKAGVEMLSSVLARELRGRNITVNAVAPGPVATDMLLTGTTDAFRAELVQFTPLQRLGVPDDIAQVVAFLVSDAGGWINGQTIRANGGTV